MPHSFTLLNVTKLVAHNKSVEMTKRPSQSYKYDLPAPDIDITKTSVWKTRKPGSSGPDFDVLCVQNTIIAKQNQEILRLLFASVFNIFLHPSEAQTADQVKASR